MSDNDFDAEQKPFVLRSSQEQMLRSVRYKEFQKRTAKFIKDSFPPVAEQLTDAQLYEIATFGYQSAAHWKLFSERAIWQYLIPVFFLGGFFDKDPQYHMMLIKARWLGSDANPIVDQEALRHEIDNWFLKISDDYLRPDFLLNGVASAYAEATLTLAGGKHITIDHVTKYISHLSPRRWGNLSINTRLSWFEVCNKRAQELELKGADRLAYFFGAFYFGYGFESNPVYPWAAALKDLKKTSENRAFEFGNSAQQHVLYLAKWHSKNSH